MQNLEMVCPYLKELEGLSPEPILENCVFIQRNNESLISQPVRTNGKHTLVCHSFLYMLHSITVLLNVMHSSMF